MPSVVLFIAVLVVVQLVGWPDAADVASSPEQLAQGQVWQLLTSALVPDGLPWAQIAVLAGTLTLGVRWLGTRWTWIVALTAHVGATLIAYVGVGLVHLVDPERVAHTIDQPDYGVSVILAGLAGGLTIAAPSRALRLAVAAVAAVAFAGAVWTSSTLATTEHALGFAIGAALVAWRRA